MTANFKGALLACAASLIAGSAFAHSSEVQAPMVPADIMALHQKMIVLDTHSDSPTETLRRPGFDITKRHSYAHDKSQIDLPRMNDGGYDGGWFVVYNDPVPLTKQGYETALADGLRKLTSVRRIAAEHPNDFEFATTPADVRRIVGSGKKAVLMSMEGSYDLGEDLKNLSAFHQFGVTMASPTPFEEQPVRRFRHRQAEVERPVAAGQAVGDRDEPPRDHHRRQPFVGPGHRRHAGPVQGADHRLAPWRQGHRRIPAQPRRRTAQGDRRQGWGDPGQLRLPRPRHQERRRLRQPRGRAPT
jgi:hypothetical protein